MLKIKHYLRKKIIIIPVVLLVVMFASYKIVTHIDFNREHRVGDPLDALDGVVVYYNGAVNHVQDRHVTPDGYNLGLRYQCVEFVKRYYYEHYQHKMPDSYGHAKHFFDPKLAHGELNKQRGLLQFRHRNITKPQKGDLFVYRPHWLNPYGHVAIVAAVEQDTVEIIQQNAGPFAATRERYALVQKGQQWHVDHDLLLGWLRLSPSTDK